MNTVPFRVYHGPQGESGCTSVSEIKETRRGVTVPLSEIGPLLVDAIRSNRTWLDDFADDEVTISTDLYEVFLAYQYFQKPSA